MKAIILGDPHIGKGTSIGKPGSGKDLNSRIKDQLDLLEFCFNKALELDVQHICCTGDLYEDARPHPALITYFMRWLKKCEKHKINVHIVMGNHDIIRTGSYIMSALDIIPAIEMTGAVVYKNVNSIHMDGLSITFVPYRDRRMYETETTLEALELLKQEIMPQLQFIPKHNTKLLVGHLALEGSIHVGDEIDDELNEIFCPSSMFKDWDYTWMGHVHNPQVMHQISKEENYYVAHIGSMDRSDFSEHEMLGRKFITIFDSDKSFQEIDLPNRGIHKIDVQTPKGKDSTEFLLNYISEFNKVNSLKDCIIKLDIKLPQDALNTDRQKVYNYVYETIKAHYICYYSESRVIETNIKINSAINNSMTPEACINTFWDSCDLSQEDRDECKVLALGINKLYDEKYMEAKV